MKLKASYSKMCVLLAIIFLMNPIVSAAGALFFSVPPSNLSSTTMSASSESTPDMPCHQDKIAQVDQKNLVDVHKMTQADMGSNCCEDVCHCDDSGCHASSLVYQVKSQIVFSTHQDHYFQLPIYLSLTFTPSSPPPIV